MAGRRRNNGEGTVWHRPDGLWAGSGYVTLTDGRRKRVTVYGKTQTEASRKLADRLAGDRRGIRTPTSDQNVKAYLDGWLTTVVKVKARPRTLELYESTIRVHLNPGLGTVRLSRLTVQDFQRFINDKHAHGASPRTLDRCRQVMRAALNRAEREGLVTQNVARLAELPRYVRKPITPWTLEESQTFLTHAHGHPWFAGYLLLLLYGMRRGEVLGLRWGDIDFHNDEIRVTQQLQRIDGHLTQAAVKTDAGQRRLPLLPASRDTLLGLLGTTEDTSSDALMLQSKNGTPVDPKNFVRAFHLIADKAGLRRITVHHTRHTAATLLKNSGAPARDAQLILGHANITTTQQLYQHGDVDGQRRALSRSGLALVGSTATETATVEALSTGQGIHVDALTSGGTSGTRTHDTLLKRLLTSPNTGPLTSVGGDVQARSDTPEHGPTATETATESTAVGERLDALLHGSARRDRADFAQHVSCPLGHDIDWLVRELLDRLGNSSDDHRTRDGEPHAA